ncbi:hypothetical protein B857_00928 [Solibacillus isronensis B3W22]|uniref:Uncharacterized protein n=1 Tax=Solibacillus isronensis B3W22 TaxID=1224748 RepID=K1LPC0_9BACL|nr:hypothetical protein [Solibacillus isronensis]AMO84335.1 hypothetical protein SOLI23_01780 [Solibacillus silvestris]EKB46034.1 hypothetical protein B857_00928 [Solibacillus isronensis B3W22]
MKRFVLLNDKHGNEILAEDLRGHSGTVANTEVGGNWLILLIPLTLFVENYLIFKYILIWNNIEQPAWYYMVLGSLIVTYLLGVLYGYIPIFSYLVIVMSIVIVFIFSLNYFDDSMWVWMLRIIFSLLIGVFTYFGNSIIKMFATPFKLLIHEMSTNYQYEDTSVAIPFRTIINIMRYRKMKKRKAKEKDSNNDIDLKREIKIIGFNRGVESIYFTYSVRDKGIQYRKRLAIRNFNNALRENIEKYGEIHPDYIPSWRPTKDELKFIERFNELLRKDFHKGLYPEPREFDFKIYRGSHAFIGIIRAPSLLKPKIFLGEFLTEVTRATLAQYEELVEQHPSNLK